MGTESSFNASSITESCRADWVRIRFSPWYKLVLRIRSWLDPDFNLTRLASKSSFGVGYSKVNRPVNRNAVVTFSNYQVTSDSASWPLPAAPSECFNPHSLTFTGSGPACIVLHLTHCPTQQSAWMNTSHFYLFCMSQHQSYFPQMHCEPHDLYNTPQWGSVHPVFPSLSIKSLSSTLKLSSSSALSCYGFFGFCLFVFF